MLWDFWEDVVEDPGDFSAVNVDIFLQAPNTKRLQMKFTSQTNKSRLVGEKGISLVVVLKQGEEADKKDFYQKTKGIPRGAC